MEREEWTFGGGMNKLLTKAWDSASSENIAITVAKIYFWTSEIWTVAKIGERHLQFGLISGRQASQYVLAEALFRNQKEEPQNLRNLLEALLQHKLYSFLLKTLAKQRKMKVVIAVLSQHLCQKFLSFLRKWAYI